MELYRTDKKEDNESLSQHTIQANSLSKKNARMLCGTRGSFDMEDKLGQQSRYVLVRVEEV
jgi:hypothetical protein